MDKILFSNSFKNLMVALGAKTSDSSYAVPLINKTSGAPQGYMEMSALASVLGAATIITNQNDLNNIVSAGVYAWSGSGTAPLNNFRPQGSLLLVWRAGAQTFQLQWPNNIEGSGLGFRVMWNNEWKPWYKVEVTLGQ